MYTYLLTVIISVVLTFTSVWKVQEWRYEAKDKARIEAEAEARKFKEKTMSGASVAYETKKEVQRVKYVKVVETVDRIVDRPVYKNVCIDEDGLKAINEMMQP